ncbi:MULTISPECIES: hypothetical protein [Catenuloplanes]|uniref:Small-conductance mechanosensitive channel n=1 Tax=Catenuloplanes niger TaxID=587534 RepID=A0AAE3ZPS1_9ACTN|nr:hypothetical protein [Catenuloplanes niger]MDR7323692.1 small-conductance mechanosensitive channel [Catenuloplanes niger]
MPAPATRPPGTVSLAAALLIVMGVVGILAAALHLLLTINGLADFASDARRFGGDPTLIDRVEGGIRGAAIAGVVLSGVVGVLLVSLAVGVRSGLTAARVATWVVCALGLCGGAASLAAGLLQRDLGSDDPRVAAVFAASADVYPGWWVAAGIGLAVAQVVGYFLVAVFLAAGTRTRTAPTAPVPTVPPFQAPPMPTVAPHPDPSRSPWAPPPPSR